MDQSARNLPAVPEQTSRTLSNRALKREIGGQILIDDHRTLLDLMYKAEAEQVEISGGRTKMYQGHELARLYVNKAMKVVYQIIGLRPEQEPSSEMMKLLNRHVCQHFPHFRVQDVYEAFVQAVAETFPAKLAHFGQVDMPYFTKVWKAYDRYAYPPSQLESPKLLAQLSPAQEHLRDRPQASEVIKDVLRQTYAKVVAGEPAGLIRLPDALWHLLYGFDMADIEQDQWARTYAEACKLVVAQKNRDVSSRQRVTLPEVEQHHRIACRNEAYRLLVAEALLQMHANGIELPMLESELQRVSYIDSPELLRLAR